MLLSRLLVDAALLALIVIALGFAISGLLMCLQPGAAGPAGDGAFRRLLEPLEVPRRIERFFYRHHRWFGSIIVLGTGFCIWRLARADILSTIPAVGLIAPLIWLLVTLCALAFFVGVFMMIRPSSLKPVESLANRWIGWRGSGAERWLAQYPRLRGFAVFLVSAYGLAVFGLLLLERVAI